MPPWASRPSSSRRSLRTMRCTRILSSPIYRSSTRQRSRCLAMTIICSACCTRRRALRRSQTMSPGRSRCPRHSAVKVVNAGGAAAFKENVRAFSFDDVVPSYGVSSRAIVKGPAACGQCARRSASAPCSLQQPRACRKRRDGADNDCRRGRAAASSRASAVLRLRQGRRTRILLGRRVACRSRERGSRA